MIRIMTCEDNQNTLLASDLVRVRGIWTGNGQRGLLHWPSVSGLSSHYGFCKWKADQPVWVEAAEIGNCHDGGGSFCVVLVM